VKIFFDTEFAERSTHVELLSIGAVREDGAEFYAENLDVDLRTCNDWVKVNVIPHFTGPAVSHGAVARGLQDLIGSGRPEFWAYYATYDADLLFRLFGGFMNCPFDQVVNDLKTLALIRGVKTQPMQLGVAHHALNDARWNRDYYNHIMEKSA